MSTQSAADARSRGAARALIRVAGWLLPWLAVLILSASVALATDQALIRSIVTPQTGVSTVVATSAGSASLLTGNSSNARTSSSVGFVGSRADPPKAGDGDVAYVRRK